MTNRVLIYLNGAQDRKEREKRRLASICDDLANLAEHDSIDLYPSVRDLEDESGIQPAISIAVCMEQRFTEPEDELPGALAASLRSLAAELEEAAARLEGGAA